MLSQPQGDSAAGRIMSMKNSSDTIRNRTRDLPACSAVPQPTAPPSAPRLNKWWAVKLAIGHNTAWPRSLCLTRLVQRTHQNVCKHVWCRTKAAHREAVVRAHSKQKCVGFLFGKITERGARRARESRCIIIHFSKPRFTPWKMTATNHREKKWDQAPDFINTFITGRLLKVGNCCSSFHEFQFYYQPVRRQTI
jgi:hypothetical protein